MGLLGDNEMKMTIESLKHWRKAGGDKEPEYFAPIIYGFGLSSAVMALVTEESSSEMAWLMSQGYKVAHFNPKADMDSVHLARLSMLREGRKFDLSVIEHLRDRH